MDPRFREDDKKNARANSKYTIDKAGISPRDNYGRRPYDEAGGELQYIRECGF